MSVFGFSDLAFLAVAAGYTPTDTDAAAYITAVETADGQALEPGVRRAIDEFVIGCKADGIWNAIKASCILAGARTLAGALVPLVGTAPTNFNFVAADYNRKTGLKGNGSTKYLDGNYAFPTSIQDNCHISGYYSALPTIGAGVIGAYGSAGNDGSFLAVTGARLYNQGTNTFFTSDTTTLGFRGINRSVSASFTYRRASSNETASISSFAVTHQNQGIFARRRQSGTYDIFTDPRIAFYSMGESLNLALLDARVTTLMYGIQKTLLEGDFDIDAAAYISRVETADGQDLEPAVRTAINDFIVGCKADGIWNAIKASCILAGARTRLGALTPLVGAAPTSFNFVDGDYNRKTGLVGNGSTKYLSSNRNNNNDPQDNKHLSVYLTNAGTSGTFQAYISAYNTTTATGSEISRSGAVPANSFAAVNSVANTPSAGGGSTGFYGTTRNLSSSYSFRVNGVAYNFSVSSVTPLNAVVDVFRRPLSTPVGYTNARLAFYSIGEALDLALLDARVTALINAFAAAIP